LTSEAIRPDGVVIREIDPLELKERLGRGDPLMLVDVREPFERSIVDLPDYGQRVIPVKQIPFAGPELDPEVEMVLYCRSGQRSAWATERLMEMGFHRVLNLKGGIMTWRTQVDSSMQAY
jgi:rhodanese-related sulfurtransferase